MPGEYPVTEQNRVKRVAKRGAYDRKSVYEVVDACLVAHVGIHSENGPVIIPMLFGRREDELFFHGSTKSRLMLALTSGEPVCMSFSLIDGVVLAKSLFHHSANYRSVTAFGTGLVIEDDESKLEALKIVSDKMMPGRWEDSRLPNVQELKGTMVVSVKIETASAKVRTGGPIDEPDDVELPFWTGVVPLRTNALEASPSDYEARTTPPEYVLDWIKSVNA